MLKNKRNSGKHHGKLLGIQLIEYILLILLFLLSYELAGYIIYHTFSPDGALTDDWRHVMLIMLSAVFLCFYKYSIFLERSYGEALKKMITVCLMLDAVFIVWLYFTSSVRLSAYYYLTASSIQIVLVFMLNLCTEFLRGKVDRERSSLVVVEDLSAIEIIKSLKKIYVGGLSVVTYKNGNLKNYVSKADHIFLTGTVTNEIRNRVISYCTLEKKKVYIVPDVFEIAVRRSMINYIGDTPTFALESFHLTDAQKLIKRSADVLLSILGLIVTFPIFVVAAIAIKYEDDGPIFYKQVRSGLNGHPFEVIKFRSMVVDAERETGAVLATENDCRITKIGCLMRSARIDEIPQFFNVLTGSMSLVGPRPERPVFVKEYCRKYPEYHYRMSVKPGITGLAQVKGNYTTTVENKLKFDLMYIINYSLLLDLKILFETVKVVLKKDQAKGFDEREIKKYIPMTESVEPDLERQLAH